MSGGKKRKSGDWDEDISIVWDKEEDRRMTTASGSTVSASQVKLEEE